MKNPPMEASEFSMWLNNEGACRESLKWQHGKTLRETWDTCERGDWLEWLLEVCGYQWTAQDRTEYERMTDQAWDEFERAWAQYKRVTDQAWAEYDRVTADTIRALIPYPFEQPTAEML